MLLNSRGTSASLSDVLWRCALNEGTGKSVDETEGIRRQPHFFWNESPFVSTNSDCPVQTASTLWNRRLPLRCSGKIRLMSLLRFVGFKSAAGQLENDLVSWGGGVIADVLRFARSAYYGQSLSLSVSVAGSFSAGICQGRRILILD